MKYSDYPLLCLEWAEVEGEGKHTRRGEKVHVIRGFNNLEFQSDYLRRLYHSPLVEKVGTVYCPLG